MEKTKKFSFLMTFEVIGKKTVDVPATIETVEEAEEWVREHWDEMNLPTDTEYIAGSDEPDFEGLSELFEEVA